MTWKWRFKNGCCEHRLGSFVAIKADFRGKMPVLMAKNAEIRVEGLQRRCTNAPSKDLGRELNGSPPLPVRT